MNPTLFSSHRLVTPLLALLLLAAPLGCQVDLDQKAAEARTELGAGRFDAAVASADATLAEAGADAPAAKVWALHRIRIEALARGGHGKRVATTLDELSSSYSAQLTPALYVATAQQLREAGAAVEAADLLSRGDQRFPDDASIDAEIEALKTLGQEGDSDLENRLESLGYL